MNTKSKGSSIAKEVSLPAREGARNRADLTAQQLRFIAEYMKDRDAKAASSRAGYSDTYAAKKSSGLLRVPAIAEEIDRRTLERAMRCDITTDDIVLELKRIAFFDVRKLFDPTTGKFRADPYEMDEQDARGLVNFDIVVLDRAGDYAVKLNPGNKMKALELLGRHLKMFSDGIHHTGTQTITYITDFGEGTSDPDD